MQQNGETVGAMAGSGALRRELSARNLHRAPGQEREQTYGEVPSVLYPAGDGAHGNFIQASYRRIRADPEWLRRLEKRYSGSRRVPRSGERTRYELDCANSSDALLMNIFCYPGALRRGALCALLGVEPGLRPVFGVKPRIPLLGGGTDQTEFDMRLGNALVEAKLTESGFQTAPLRLVARYRDLDGVFEAGELAVIHGNVQCYQLIRGVLAAHVRESSFLVLCDGRRGDLIERWFQTMRAVRSCSLRSRLKLITWQEAAATLSVPLREFLEEKYGIRAEL